MVSTRESACESANLRDGRGDCHDCLHEDDASIMSEGVHEALIRHIRAAILSRVGLMECQQARSETCRWLPDGCLHFTKP